MAYKELSKHDAADLVVTSYQDWKTLKQEWNEKFREASRIYRSEAAALKWPGSNKERANVKVQLAADHVDSAWPLMVYNLFFSSGEDFYDVVVDGDPAVARGIRDRIFFDLSYPDQTGRTGIWELSEALWDFIYLGFGATDVVYSEKLKRTVVRRRDPYKLYLPVVDGGWYSGVPAWIYRNRVPIKHLKALRGTPGFSVPGDAELMRLSKLTGSEEEEMENEERQKDGHASEVGFISENPQVLSVPTLMYQSGDHQIWVLTDSREDERDTHLIMQAPNPLGITTLSGAWYHPHRKGLTQILAEEQNLARKATNFSLDYLSISLMPPRNNRSGALGPQSNQLWHPGSITKSREDDMQPQHPGPIAKELFDVFAQSDMRAQRRSGMNSSHLVGVMPPSNANRTLGGVQAVQASSNIRQFGPLWRADAGIIAPTLHKLHQANRRFDSRESQPALSTDGKNKVSRVSRSLLDTDAQFVVQSATRTVGRLQLLQSLPLMLQYIFNPEILKAAAQNGMTLAWDEINELFHYATGLTRKFNLFEAMSPEQVQAQQQAQLAEKQMDAQTRLQIMQMKLQGEQESEKSRRAGEDDKTAADLMKTIMSLGNPPPPEDEGGSDET